MKRTILAACMAALSLPVAAETFRDYPDLPPLAAVEQALKNTAMARTAQAGMGVASASRDQLRAGHYEIGVRASVPNSAASKYRPSSSQNGMWDWSAHCVCPARRGLTTSSARRA
jgi:hypothetical protein